MRCETSSVRLRAQLAIGARHSGGSRHPCDPLAENGLACAEGGENLLGDPFACEADLLAEQRRLAVGDVAIGQADAQYPNLEMKPVALEPVLRVLLRGGLVS